MNQDTSADPRVSATERLHGGVARSTTSVGKELLRTNV